jgi:hypothetical protein
MLSRLVVCALVVVAAGCGGGGEERRSVTAPRSTTTPTDSRPDSRVPDDALIGIVTAWDGSGTLVAPVNRRTLQPGVPWTELGEYHDAWSLSPDRRLAAFGISAPGDEGRIGIRVIDLGTFQIVKDIAAGIAAEAVGWIAPDRLAAFLQSGEVIVVDPASGEELAREALGATSCPFTPQNAVTRLGFVFVVAVAGSARLVVADAQGRVRTVRLGDISLGEAHGICQEAGLAVDRRRLVAYVVGAGAPVAAIDLRTLRVTRHRVADAPALLAGSGCAECGAQRAAHWVGGRRFAVTGFDRRPTRRAFRSRTTPAGAALVDTRTWTARVIAPRAGAVRVSGGRLLAYDGRHPVLRPRAGSGLRVHDQTGRLRRTLLEGERVGDVQVAGGRVYARTARGLRVVRRGQVIARLPRVRRDVDLLR